MRAVLEWTAKMAGVNILFSRYQAQTSFVSCFSAMLANAESIEEQGLSFDYVYLHSDSDLLIRGGIVTEITKHSYGIMRQLVDYRTWEWGQAPLMRQDSRLLHFMESYKIGFDELVFGRAEGSFFDWESWTLIIQRIRQFFNKDDSYFENTENHWTAEEVIFPTAAHHFLGSSSSLHRDQLIFTKLAPDGKRNAAHNMLTKPELDQILKEGRYFGAKRFSSDLINEATRSIYPSPLNIYNPCQT